MKKNWLILGIIILFAAMAIIVWKYAYIDYRHLSVEQKYELANQLRKDFTDNKITLSRFADRCLLLYEVNQSKDFQQEDTKQCIEYVLNSGKLDFEEAFQKLINYSQNNPDFKVLLNEKSEDIFHKFNILFPDYKFMENYLPRFIIGGGSEKYLSDYYQKQLKCSDDKKCLQVFDDTHVIYLLLSKQITLQSNNKPVDLKILKEHRANTLLRALISDKLWLKEFDNTTYEDKSYYMQDYFLAYRKLWELYEELGIDRKRDIRSLAYNNSKDWLKRTGDMLALEHMKHWCNVFQEDGCEKPDALSIAEEWGSKPEIGNKQRAYQLFVYLGKMDKAEELDIIIKELRRTEQEKELERQWKESHQ